MTDIKNCLFGEKSTLKMKIRTSTDLLDYISGEWSWRRKELTALRSNIHSSRAFAKNTALRSGIALLYAHWEGFVKNVATAYLELVSRQKLPYGSLKDNFWAIAIKNELNSFEESKKASIHNRIVYDIKSMDAVRSSIPYENVIKTNSNLKSDIFVEIMSAIGLDYSYFESDFQMLDSVLLEMRNKIAHGDNAAISLDEVRFDEIYDIIIKMMETFRAEVENAAVNKSYLRTN